MDNEKQELTISFSNFLGSVKRFFLRLLSIADEVDKPAVDENIRKDVEFQGFNIWILICSISICSIGLNMNSTAVIIGAMLISPLMGPLVGMGYSVGTFDRDLLIKSLKNLVNALIIAITASYLFFQIAPTSHDQSELLSRTSPSLLDLLVALFGGFAGILAVSRKIKTNVIPGVAIATALMPPLCTAGYALASANFDYFLGAFYLFAINSVMITLSALIVVWYLRFPKMTYVNQKIQKRVRLLIIVFVLGVSVPSIYAYRTVLKETIFLNRANTFIKEVINDEEHKVFDPEIILGENGGYMRLFVYGEPYTDQQIDSIKGVLAKYHLSGATLVLENMGSLEESRSMLRNAELEVTQKDQMLEDVQFELLKRTEELNELRSLQDAQMKYLIDQGQLTKEAKAISERVGEVSYNLQLTSSDSISGIPTFLIMWEELPPRREHAAEFERLRNWIVSKYETRFESLNVYEVDRAVSVSIKR